MAPRSTNTHHEETSEEKPRVPEQVEQHAAAEELGEMEEGKEK